MNSYGIYADSEAICTKHYGCKPNPEKKATTRIKKKSPCSFGSGFGGFSQEKEKLTVVHCTDDNYLSFSYHVPVGEYMTKEGA